MGGSGSMTGGLAGTSRTRPESPEGHVMTSAMRCFLGAKTAREALRGQVRTEGNRWYRFVRAGQPALFTFASSWPMKPTTSA